MKTIRQGQAADGRRRGKGEAAWSCALKPATWPRLATVLGLAAALGLAGCETGRTNKAHASWQHLSDETTTSKPQSTQALGPGSHQPPVPGSPTAAGEDGNQPPDDSQAMARHGNEHGEPAAPFAQPADSPERK